MSSATRPAPASAPCRSSESRRSRATSTSRRSEPRRRRRRRDASTTVTLLTSSCDRTVMIRYFLGLLLGMSLYLFCIVSVQWPRRRVARRGPCDRRRQPSARCN